VTRRGRDVLDLMCRALAERGVTLLEADTDGVYFAVPETWTEADERRVVSDVAALLPPLVQLEFDGRYRAMLSHEPKNYALLGYDGTLVLKGVAFRSSRAEPFGEQFLRRSIARLLSGDVNGVREIFAATVSALRLHELSTWDVSSRVRLTKSPERYAQLRERRREFVYEALLGAGRTDWSAGDRVRVYRRSDGDGGVVAEGDDGMHDPQARDPRDYDADHYVRVLRETFAERLSRAVTPEAFAAIVADPSQPSLFDQCLAASRPVLTPVRTAS
jgi:DNA polymerase I